MEFLKALETIRSPFLDTVISAVTRLGEETFGVVILCAIFWCISKQIAYSIGVVYFISGLTVQGMKIGFRIERPWVIDPAFNPVPSALEHATGYSFPSGHTQSAAALYGSLGVYARQRWLKWTCFTIALLVAFSRLYLGVHTPQDVITSLLICAALITIVYFLYKGDEINNRRDLFIALAMIAFIAVIAVYAITMYTRGIIAEKFVSDCLKAAGAGLGYAVGMYVERTYIKFSVKTKKPVWQVVKYVLGIAGVLAIQEGLKLIIGTGIVVDTIRYFLMLSWISMFYPLIIKRFFENR